jgi:DNA-directed RNA polymerase subunit RPC12/RpoP
VPCNDPTTPDPIAGFDQDAISAAAQLATLNKATFNANNLYTQTLYQQTLNDFTTLREVDVEASIDYTDFDVEQGQPSGDVDSDEESDSEATEAGPSRKRGASTLDETVVPPESRSSLPLAQPAVCRWLIDAENGQVCGKTFSRTQHLHDHVDKEHIDRLAKDDTQCYRCQWEDCKRTEEQTFSAKPKLKRHVQTHTHHKPYKCEYCNTNMKTKDALEKHRRTHTGEAPYRCDKCNKTFKTSTEHKTHMTAVHSDEKPHQCPHCGQRFADSSNLSKHKKTHYKGSWKCLQPGCKAEMKRWDQIRRHFMTQKHCQGLLIEGSVEQTKYKKDMQDRWNALPESEKLLPVDKKSAPVTQTLPTPDPSRPPTVVQGEERAAASSQGYYPNLQHNFTFQTPVPPQLPVQQQYYGNQGLDVLSAAAHLPSYQASASASQTMGQSNNKRQKVQAAA